MSLIPYPHPLSLSEHIKRWSRSGGGWRDHHMLPGYRGGRTGAGHTVYRGQASSIMAQHPYLGNHFSETFYFRSTSKLFQPENHRKHKRFPASSPPQIDTQKLLIKCAKALPKGLKTPPPASPDNNPCPKQPSYCSSRGTRLTYVSMDPQQRSSRPGPRQAADAAALEQGSPIAPPTEAPIAAFFDLDKTIIATSSALAYGKEFLQSGMISPTEAFQMSLSKVTYLLQGHNDQQIEATKDQLASLVTGWEEQKVREIAQQGLESVLMPTIYAEARELIEWHKGQGHDVIIISASARQLVEPIAAELGVGHVVATELEAVDGVFTGNLPFFCKGAQKAQAIVDLTTAKGYDLKNSYAYSDSITDLPMLEAVGHPVAINPDRNLRKAALDRGWEIRTLKKPVPLFPKPAMPPLPPLPPAPTKRELGISTGVAAAVAALTFGVFWISKHSTP